MPAIARYETLSGKEQKFLPENPRDEPCLLTTAIPAV
ncbi:hypothetical protein TRIP_B200403 [uncultured Desulfatiglans sp.]|nr:hypothetical protein TRIP_B200403 [uncultured Desulfatiglans sp.]